MHRLHNVKIQTKIYPKALKSCLGKSGSNVKRGWDVVKEGLKQYDM